ncbi:putative transcriptional regulator [Escherichia coli]|nr:putative transcriptional regulator [Escherichia coli]
MNNVKLLIAGSAFFAMSAQAADRVSIDVKVTLEAAACTPILSNGGVVNFGSHSVNRLSTQHYTQIGTRNINMTITGFAPIFPDICYHLTHYKPAAADIPVASDNPAHYADAIRYNARTPLQGSLLPLTRLVWA